MSSSLISPEANLLSLAPELIQVISQTLDSSAVKQLRLTCKTLAELLGSQLLHTITIAVSKSKFEQGLSKLVGLSTAKHAARNGTRKLVIGSLSPAYDPEGKIDWRWDDATARWVVILPPEDPSEALAEEQIASHLFNAIASMKSVENIEWTPQEKDTERVHRTVMDALNTMPNLRSFRVVLTYLRIPLGLGSFPSLLEINVQGISETRQEDMLEGLAKVVSNNLGLTLIEIDNIGPYSRTVDKFQSLHQLFKYYPANTPTLRLRHLRMNTCLFRLDDITIPHLLHLTSLDLTCIEEPNTLLRNGGSDPEPNDSSILQEKERFGSSLENVWKALRVAGVQLESIKIDVVPHSFVDYLSSYSGLKKLVLFPNSFTEQQTSDSVASWLFGAPLGSHVHTLEQLTVSTPYETLWCLGSHNLEILSKCNRMKYLCMSVNASQLLDDKKDIILPPGDGPDVIKLLLDMAATYMSNIKTIHVLEACLLSCCGSRPCGTHSMQQPSGVNSIVTTILANYTAPPSCHQLPCLSIRSLTGRYLSFISSSSSDTGTQGPLRYVPTL